MSNNFSIFGEVLLFLKDLATWLFIVGMTTLAEGVADGFDF